jgi:hypothetical protein
MFDGLITVWRRSLLNDWTTGPPVGLDPKESPDG